MASPKIRETLAGAGYRIHQQMHVGRCARCSFAAPGRKQHGRNCTKLHVAVVSHGVCNHYVSAARPAPQAAGRDTAEISVRYTAGAHVTNTIAGQRASSTASAEEAARSLCRKLFQTESGFTLMRTHVEPGREVFNAIKDAT